MGQQQLLLIILGVIVVGIAVAVGITMFQDNAVSANRDAVTNDLVNLAARAQQFYRRPTALGGGQGSFALCTTEGGWSAVVLLCTGREVDQVIGHRITVCRDGVVLEHRDTDRNGDTDDDDAKDDQEKLLLSHYVAPLLVW